ncbi:MAG: Slp family lipoprotein [Nitrosomonas sp.]|uniref:Slp family lipoprotein n=1 Tax=Nitrosomonas sp. TaxID=42353 RepID=UPI0025F931DD|nr:Slp family lipoprotein [Nitrosomonas sp.]MBY0475506.1 Slp family lipoprotein [Nitrosomonas sp.]
MKSFLLLLPYFLLSGCAGLPPAIGNAPAINVSYNQLSHDINNYKDEPVRWGGVIINVENEKNASLMQVLYYPLDFGGRPQPHKAGEGRFVVKTTEFLDPEVYAKDKEITVVGVIAGDIEQTVGKRIIQVPLLSATAIHLWPINPSYYINRGYGYPYFGYPAYPGYNPFFGGGFYGPYYRW